MIFHQTWRTTSTGSGGQAVQEPGGLLTLFSQIQMLSLLGSSLRSCKRRGRLCLLLCPTWLDLQPPPMEVSRLPFFFSPIYIVWQSFAECMVILLVVSGHSGSGGGFRSRGRGGYGSRSLISGSNAVPVGGRRPW